MALMELLSNNPIFSHMNEVEMGKLKEMTISRTYPKGDWITHHGDIWPYLFIVDSGIVTALKESSEGRSLIVVSLGQGEVFWGISFFQEDVPMPVSLVAGEESVIHLWTKDRFLPVLLQDGRMSWELAQLMVTRMLRASDIVEELAFQPITGRLARFVLDHFGDAIDDYVSRDITLEEMAARIGTTREMVCRQLYRFVDEGAIQINRTEFMITDRDLLEKMAGKVKG
jgi:CRP/FNR family cyclic AMP-dependent transcriptional regulator